MVDMNAGMDIMQVKDFIEEKVIHEENPEILLDYVYNPNFYQNALKYTFDQRM